MRAEEEERVDDFLLNITCLPVDWNKIYTLLQWTATRTYFTESKVFLFFCSKNDLKMEIFHMKIKAQSKTTFDSRHIYLSRTIP